MAEVTKQVNYLIENMRLTVSLDDIEKNSTRRTCSWVTTCPKIKSINAEVGCNRCPAREQAEFLNGEMAMEWWRYELDEMEKTI